MPTRIREEAQMQEIILMGTASKTMMMRVMQMTKGEKGTKRDTLVM